MKIDGKKEILAYWVRHVNIYVNFKVHFSIKIRGGTFHTCVPLAYVSCGFSVAENRFCISRDKVLKCSTLT